jgi:fused signal recognition particle receptor
MEKPGLFNRLKAGLSKTRQGLAGSLDTLFSGENHIAESIIDELEEILITSDLGVRTIGQPMEKPGLFNRLKAGLSKTRQGLAGSLDTLFSGENLNHWKTGLPFQRPESASALRSS